ncbi:MAG: hypothetical protein RBR37_03215 [Advenella sp.]|nr:hypothetical protein [Advenella sp.]
MSCIINNKDKVLFSFIAVFIPTFISGFFEVIYPEMAASLFLPLDLTVVSGINVIAHAVESLYAYDLSPITESFAIQGVLALMKAIPDIEQCRFG